ALICSINGDIPFSEKISIHLHETFAPDTKRMKDESEDSLECFADGSFIFYAVKNDDGTDFGAVLKVATDGSVNIEESAALNIQGSTYALIIAGFFVKDDRKKAFARLRLKLQNMNKSYEEYLEIHAAEHFRLFNSCDIDLGGGSGICNEEILLNAYKDIFPNELFEKLWRFGRYLLISGTSDLPFPLYGLWGGRYNLMWSHNMANENLQMIYWHTFTGGLADMFKAVIDYYTGLLDDFSENAKKIFGLPGIYVPAGSCPGMGLPNQIVPVIMNWIGAAGWLSQQFYQYYLYTGDEKLLREKILPFMEKAIDFYEAYLVLDPKTGFYKIYPSVSPENSPKNFFTKPEHERMPHICPSAINATMDFAIIKELVANMLEVSCAIGVNADKIDRWREMLGHIPQYQINIDGAVKEWMCDEFIDRYSHRHISHIYPVFPGREYIKGRDNEHMLAAFEQAVNKRVLGSQTGWSFSHMACIYARFEKGEAALNCLKNLAKSCLLKNFMTLHNDWRRMGITMNLGDGNTAPMQLDANMGIVNALQEMLLFVSDSIIKLLPACPAQFGRGRVTGLRFCTGKVSFCWDKELKMFSCKLEAERDTNILLVMPDIAEKYELDSESGKMENALKKEAVAVRLKSGGSIAIKSL
ncbi:MAG TPA: alpha-L-fucosidase, partial [Ruminococcaceae bacterium]|nr:alpha-L-fucosidase [Oscillospiraceae bacterium]